MSIHTAAGQGCRVATSRSALAARREEAKGAVTAVETEAAARVVGEEVMEVRVAVRAVGVTVAVGMEVGEPVEWLYLNGFCLVVVWLLYDNGLFVWLLYGCCLVVVYRIP